MSLLFWWVKQLLILFVSGFFLVGGIRVLIDSYSIEDPFTFIMYFDKKGLDVGLLSDKAGTVLNLYGAWQMKKQCGKECMGTVRSTVLIDPRGKVAEVRPKVTKAAGHAAKVLEALQSRVQ